MTKQEVVQYLKDNLTADELRGPIAITCPNCKSTGWVGLFQTCPICEGERFIRPKKFIEKTKQKN